MTFPTRTLAIFAVAVLCSWQSVAQQTPPPAAPVPETPQPQDQTQTQPQTQTPPQTPTQAQPPAQTQANPKEKTAEEKEIEKKEQSQRVLGVLPQFSVTSRQNASPLTSGEKFHLFAKATIDPVTLTITGFQAALSQAENEFPAYGQGAAGYGKRYGASFADGVSSGFFSNYFYPVILKQDPRYFRLGEGHSVAHRLLFGAKQEFWCHDDKGKHVINWSSILGSFTSGAVSNLYYPGRTLISTTPGQNGGPPIKNYEDDRGVGLTLSRSSIALAYGMAGGVFDEFWPDINHWLHRHKKNADGTPASAPPTTPPTTP